MTHKTADESFTTNQLRDLVISVLEDLKAIDIQEVNVAGHNPLTDLFVVASGNSTRHVKSMAEKLLMNAKAKGHPPLGIEGEKEGEWVLVDLNDVIVHIMLPQTRAFYNLEKLWEASSQQRGGASRSA
ncbi:MAG: ribosome silencing factor [Xanthomonadales bacterium]|nr:ribosome silencing factor [Gammaproteobacteria bacterium]MBT8054496.1 ribosome silencing factor [Gammaproteobacteria bacterium]NND57711.1 ribosome silencing factor [Xanthomonadales bacterium]NNK52618.1 ribosome silencing factor [Xanthomonadales bacterium]